METKQKSGFEVRTTRQITDEHVRNVLVTALDGGCGGSWYWAANYDHVRFEFPEGITALDFRDTENGGTGRFTVGEYYERIQLIPLHPDCSVVFFGHEDHPGEFRLNRESIATGLQLLAEKNPSVFNEIFVEENDDANSADIFLQYCLFGEEIFS